MKIKSDKICSGICFKVRVKDQYIKRDQLKVEHGLLE